MNMGSKMIQHKYSFAPFIVVLLVFGICCKGVSIAGDQGIIPNEVVKQILKHPRLTAFFHPEIKGRVPIVIQSNFVDPNIKIIMYEKPVVVIPDSKKQLITNIYMSFFEDGKVSISYPVEGLKGVFKFIPDTKGSWVLEEANVWEE
jgi:hypothetical protein